MKPGISFTRVWIDDDMAELHIEICDEHSLFSNRIYVGHQQLRDAVTGLHAFKDHVAGGIFNLRFGEFGAEYASGAFDARLHFRKRGKIFVRVLAQSEFRHFEDREVASEATLYLVSEPAQLDEFIASLKIASEGGNQHAELGAVAWD